MKCSKAWGIMTLWISLLLLVLSVLGNAKAKPEESVVPREKRGAAYAGGHPGNGYGVGGVGIPGINSVIQYSAYNALLNSGNHGGYGSSSGHGRKLTVDEAIGRFGHHQTSQPYPYTAGHNPGGSQGHGSPGRNIPIIGTTHGNAGYQSSGYGGTGVGHRGGNSYSGGSGGGGYGSGSVTYG